MIRLVPFFLCLVTTPLFSSCPCSKKVAVTEGSLSQYCFDGKKLILSEEEWKERLSPEQYKALREYGSEMPFANKYFATIEKGIYNCAGCGLPLFSSKDKYEAETGWPSFTKPICEENITLEDKSTKYSKRIAVECSKCDGHIGHLFYDGPPPTGKRYCMNSIALDFVPE